MKAGLRTGLRTRLVRTGLLRTGMFRKLFLTISAILVGAYILAALLGKWALDAYFLRNSLLELAPQLDSIAEDISKTGHTSTRLTDLGFILKAYDLNNQEMSVFTHEELPPTVQGRVPITEEDIRTALNPYISRVLAGESVTKIGRLTALRGETVLIGRPLKRDGNEIGAVFILKLASDYNSAQRGFYLTFLLASTLSLLLILTVIYKVLQRMSRSLYAMTVSSNAMAAGNYQFRVPEDGYAELGLLAASMNTLASRLESNEEAAARLEQTRRDYVANVSHELRTPIAAIRAMSETLCDGMLGDEQEQQRFYHLIQHESVRLQRLINDMLELSRLQSGSASILKSQVEAAPLIRAIQDRFEIIAEDLDISFQITDSALKMPDFYGNRDRTEQVLIILLDNAFKFTREEGRVYVDASWDAEKVTVSVINEGAGIPEEDLPYLFDRFYKSDKSRSGSGTGLGLSIARQIMTQLGESIEAASENGETRFFFTLSRTAGTRTAET
ncbi:sensor histidine kinase [Paenibacillus pinistramenti]|uniref:sensor histidine kinase n=1 Tax=Paenibacillus pinistramenti TaxID=1768003 RepID=UPI001108F63D|nr:ATP-binding protein [Paenibacillus pinistramenti]